AEPAVGVGRSDRRLTLTEPAFIGRSRELAALQAALDDARKGNGGPVMLEAESGGGKTRLLDELALRALQQGAWVLRGKGLDQAAQRPFQLLDGLVSEVVFRGSSDQELAQGLQQRLADHREAVCEALPQLAELLDPRR